MSIDIGWGTKDEQARRNAAKKGIANNTSDSTIRRREARKRRDELQAMIDYGVPVFYRDVGR